MDENSEAIPDAFQLIGLLQICKGVSPSWLLGQRAAKKIDERFIDKRIGFDVAHAGDPIPPGEPEDD
jgi:hypothetical protein